MTNHLAKISNNAALRNTLILCLSNIWWLVQLTKLAQSIRSYGLGSRQPLGSHYHNENIPQSGCCTLRDAFGCLNVPVPDFTGCLCFFLSNQNAAQQLN